MEYIELQQQILKIDNREAPLALMWHRRDLRVHDNAALHHALKSGYHVLPVFIFDTNILSKLEDKADRRVQFIYNEVLRLKQIYMHAGSDMLVVIGDPTEIFAGLLVTNNISAVFANDDYEPYAVRRDNQVKSLLQQNGLGFSLFKDHVIFHKNEILKPDNTPYTVFTPYMKRWKERLNQDMIAGYETVSMFSRLARPVSFTMPGYEMLGFKRIDSYIPHSAPDVEKIRNYHLHRDYPARDGTSRLGVHLRFGTVSIRDMVQLAAGLNETWLNELIWREFFQMILWHFPHSAEKAFKPEYDRIAWINDPDHFNQWCNGLTGYPLVDAGMRELLATGYMHNRVRMVVASFLCKHMLIDWRLGEAWFARHLLDYEMASNVGNWQWAAGSGCDAAPYFRVFNPALQASKFDPESTYIRKWVPEYGTKNYPSPVVDHESARKRAVMVYRNALSA